MYRGTFAVAVVAALCLVIPAASSANHTGDGSVHFCIKKKGKVDGTEGVNQPGRARAVSDPRKCTRKEYAITIALGGTAGAPGIQGATGPAGPVGPAGNNGTNGSAGPAGVAGPVGATGATGATGAKGATGGAGPKGATGATGVAGPKGPTGPTGPTGVAGGPGTIGGEADSITGNKDEYFGMFMDESVGIGSLSTVQQVLTEAGTLSDLNIRLDDDPGGGIRNYVFTVWDGNVPTGVTCTVTGAGQSCADAVNSHVFAAGDLIAIEAHPSPPPDAPQNVHVGWTATYGP
jgi:hypothetical protein